MSNRAFHTSLTVAMLATAATSGCLSVSSSKPKPNTHICDCTNPTNRVEVCLLTSCATACLPGYHEALTCMEPPPPAPTATTGPQQPLSIVAPDSRLVVIDRSLSSMRISSGGAQSAAIPVSGVANVTTWRNGEIAQLIKIGRLELVAGDFSFLGKTVRGSRVINAGAVQTDYFSPQFFLPKASMHALVTGLADSVPVSGVLSADRDVSGTFDQATGKLRIAGTFADAAGSVTYDITGQAQPVGLDTDGDTVPDVIDNCPKVANTSQNRLSAPAITAPPPVSITSCGNTAALGQPVVVDTCGAGAVSFGNDAPSRFLPGQTVVTWTARDGAGNQSSATQVVTVAGDTSCCPAGTNVIVGTSNNDVLNGTPGNDCILGLGSQDIIHGGGGNDYIVGGDGDDQIYGEAGSDTLAGGPGQDRLEGGTENDVLDGSDGDDLLWGGAGNDELRGGQGNDMLSGDAGNDSLIGQAGYDNLNGGSGTDVCTAAGGTDTYVQCETAQ